APVDVALAPGEATADRLAKARCMPATRVLDRHDRAMLHDATAHSVAFDRAEEQLVLRRAHRAEVELQAGRRAEAGGEVDRLLADEPVAGGLVTERVEVGRRPLHVAGRARAGRRDCDSLAPHPVAVEVDPAERRMQRLTELVERLDRIRRTRE